MRRECQERFPRHRLQRKPLVNDPVMHHGTCVTHVPWFMSGSLTRGGGENVPGFPGACATHNFAYLVRGPKAPFNKRFSIDRNVVFRSPPKYNKVVAWNFTMQHNFYFVVCATFVAIWQKSNFIPSHVDSVFHTAAAYDKAFTEETRCRHGDEIFVTGYIKRCHFETQRCC